jgi:hypothetical protein
MVKFDVQYIRDELSKCLEEETIFQDCVWKSVKLLDRFKEDLIKDPKKLNPIYSKINTAFLDFKELDTYFTLARALFNKKGLIPRTELSENELKLQKAYLKTYDYFLNLIHACLNQLGNLYKDKDAIEFCEDLKETHKEVIDFLDSVD